MPCPCEQQFDGEFFWAGAVVVVFLFLWRRLIRRERFVDRERTASPETELDREKRC